MKRIGLIIFVGFVLLCAARYYKKNNSKHYSLYRCALVVPAEHPAMDEIIKGFVETVKATVADIDLVVFNGQGNKTLLHTQLESVVNSNFDIVFTIGATASQLTTELLKKRNSLNIKHIFTAVDDPVTKGLVESLGFPGVQSTGVISDSHVFLEKQIDALIKIKPNVSHILLVYDPAHPDNSKEKYEIAQICQKKNIMFSDVAVMQTSELAHKVPMVINSVDTVLVLKDHLVVTGIDLLIKICSARNITLYCSDLNSGQKGAALAFGVYEYDYGKHAGRMAIDLLVHKKTISDIPVHAITEHHLLINKRSCQKQGISIAPSFEIDKAVEGIIFYE